MALYTAFGLSPIYYGQSLSTCLYQSNVEKMLIYYKNHRFNHLQIVSCLNSNHARSLKANFTLQNDCKINSVKATYLMQVSPPFTSIEE